MIRRLPFIPTIIVVARRRVDGRARRLAAAAREVEGRAARAICGGARSCRRSPFRRCRSATTSCRCSATRPGVCLRPSASARSRARTAPASRAIAHIVDCATGAEGPGMSVEVGWSKNPEREGELDRRPGQRHHRARSGRADAAGRGERAAGPRAEQDADVSTVSPITPGGHRGYAATWFALGGRGAGHLWACRAQSMLRGAQSVSGEQHVLPNGLTVAVDPLPEREIGRASASTRRVGSRSEPARLGGLAHLVEHMVFKGAGGRDTRALAEVDRGCRRLLNAWTARDQTVFHGRALARDLPLVAELIADLVRAPAFRRGPSRAREAGDPVRTWRKRRFTRRPRPRPSLRSGVRRPADRPPGARHRSERARRHPHGLLRLARTAIRARRGWCSPASGKVDPEQVLEARGEAVRRHARLAKFRQSSPRTSPAACATIAASFEQAHWCLAFRRIGRRRTRATRRSPCSSQALGGGTSSRLFQELREERGLAYSIYAWSQAFADTGHGRDRLRGRAAAGGRIGPAGARCARRDRRGLDPSRAQPRPRAGRGGAADGASKRRRAAPITWRARSRCSDGSCRSTKCSTKSAPSRSDEARASGAALLEGPVAVASVGAKLALAA